MFAAIVRDTRGVVLSDSERFNHFPAGPFCGVTTVVDGTSHVISNSLLVTAPADGPVLPSCAVSGPQRNPTVSWNPGPVFAVTFVFYPDAFAALSGCNVSGLVDDFESGETVLPDQVLALFLDFQRAAQSGPIHRSFRTLEDCLELYWDKARPPGHLVSVWLKDWRRSLGARAAMSGAGRSARQIERRIKAWTGLSGRDLDVFGRNEQLYSRLGQALEAKDFSWARLATDAGYSDQSHMVRRVRRDTGLPPEQLLRAVATQEAYWCYRLLGERF